MSIDPRLVIVAAVARNGVIGRSNAMPWHLPEDLRRFRKITLGGVVVMGRRTYEAIGKALPGRSNIVVSHRADLAVADGRVAASFDRAVQAAGDAPRIFIIGGAQLYAQALPRTARMLLTEIDADYEGDTRFPPFVRAQWSEVSRESLIAQAPPGLRYAFVEYVRSG